MAKVAIEGWTSDGAAVAGHAGSGTGVVGTSSSGHGVKATSAGSAAGGAAVWAESRNTTDGIAIWAKNNSGDATLVVGNDGSGILIKGFGGDGGEDEFRVNNDGSIWAEGDVTQDRTSDGLVKAAVYAACSNVGASISRSFNNVGGTITIANGPAVGRCTIDFGFKVDDRYFVATAASLNRGASCYWGSTEAKLDCMRWTDAGTGENGYIMVVVY